MTYQLIFSIKNGNINENNMPDIMPDISIAAANMPAVEASFGETVCGVYIIPKEL